MNASIQWTDLATALGMLVMLIGALWRGWAMVQAVRDELAGFKLRVAEKYVSSDSLREIEDRLVAAIERLGERLDRVIDKASRN